MKYNDGFLETILVDIWNSTGLIAADLNLLTILAGVSIGIMLILNTVIIINQIRIRKELKKLRSDLSGQRIKLLVKDNEDHSSNQERNQ